MTKTKQNYLLAGQPFFSNALAEALPHCCIYFKRHKLYSNENTGCLAKFWYYCNIEGCELEGTAVLDTSLSLTLCNKYIELKHEKGKRKSFQARPVKGEERKVLAKAVTDMTYPSKLYHRRLSALHEESFLMGNLKNVPRSKSVITQCRYEYRKANQVDESLINSLKTLKSKYNAELNSKSVPGFMQFVSLDPLTVALWTESESNCTMRCQKNTPFLLTQPERVLLNLMIKRFYILLLYHLIHV